MKNIVSLREVLATVKHPYVNQVDPRYHVDLAAECVLRMADSLPLVTDSSSHYNLVKSPGNFYKTRISRHEIRKVISNYKTIMGSRTVSVTDKNTVKSGSFVIGSIVHGTLKLSSVPVIHDNEVKATIEAERLAKLSPGTEFVVLRINGTCTAGAVVWK